MTEMVCVHLCAFELSQTLADGWSTWVVVGEYHTLADSLHNIFQSPSRHQVFLQRLGEAVI